MSTLNYRPEIDGLRAVAVIPVVLFHLGFSWINGGYLGVDVFFVISGFLITSILLKENTAQAFSYKKFWLRRIRRILPALLVMIIGVLIASYFVAFKPMLKSYADDGVSAVFSYANLNMLLKFGDYWGMAASSSPFLHAWSLSVEEQFYLLYPALITTFFLLKLRTWPVLAIITVLSFGLFVYTSIAFPKYGFYLLPTRAWELAAGGLLAATGTQMRASLSVLGRNLLALLGLILILASYFLFPTTEVISMLTVVPVLGSVLFIGFSSTENIAGRLLSNRVVVFIGKISYSLYLWHWPVIVLAKRYVGKVDYNQAQYLVWVLSIISATAIASYLLVEIPTRKFKPILSLVTVLLVICISIVAVFNSNLIDVNYRSVFSKTKFYGVYYNINPKVSAAWQAKESERPGVYVPLQRASFKNSFAHGGIPGGKGPGYPELVLLGDSHGGMWAKLVDEIGSELNIKESIYTINGTNPLFQIPYPEHTSDDIGTFSQDQWNTYANGLIHNLNTWKPKVLVVASRWSIRTAKDFHNLESLILLARHNGTSVILINEPPVVSVIQDNNATEYLSFLGFKPNGKNQYIALPGNESVQASNAALNSLASKFDNCRVLDINQLYRKNDKGMVIRDKSVLYFDDDHLSYQGTLVAKKVIKNAVSAVCATHSDGAVDKTKSTAFAIH
jgi:peptidoglycan/LPS O-acetylase OafA/YrhL